MRENSFQILASQGGQDEIYMDEEAEGQEDNNFCVCASFKQEGAIGCDKCYRWFHWSCAGFKREEDLPGEKENWYCQDCERDNRESL